MPALVTPFNEEGDLDIDSHRFNLTTLDGRGVEGFLIGGSTGEGPYLEPGERRQLIDAARDELGGKPFIACGISVESLRAAVTACEEASDAGADAVLVMTPTSLARGRHEWVRRFYEALDDAVDLPLMLYSVPVVTGYDLPVDVVTTLAGRPGVAGMKDSGGDPVRSQQITSAVSSEFFLFAGASRALSLSVAGGAHGGITSSANYASGLVRDVVGHARKGVDKAEESQEKLTGLSALVEARGLAGVKLAAEVAGLRPGYPRAPVWRLEGEEAASLRKPLEALKGQLLG